MNQRSTRVLYYGSLEGNSGSRLRGLQECGFNAEGAFERDPTEQVHRWQTALEWRLKQGPATWRLNRGLLRRARQFRPDIVWIETGKLVYARTIAAIKREIGCALMNTYSDDFLYANVRSRHYLRSIPHYDVIFTPRQVNYSELRARGARQVDKFWKGYNPKRHFPEKLSAPEIERYGADVVFVGHAEPTRVEVLEQVCRIPRARLRIWGGGWQHQKMTPQLRRCCAFRGAEREEYRKALCGGRIALHFLSRWNRDTQSSRSFEIPACSLMMLAERTDDHLACFVEDKEAVYFSSSEELLGKLRYYLHHDSARERIAAAGHERCVRSGYSNANRAVAMVERTLELVGRV